MTTLARGQLLGERFELTRPLGKGGMGEVWLTEDRELEDRVVAKVVPADASEDELALLKRECKNARKLAHSNIVPVYDFHRAAGVSFITMAYVEGENIGCLRGRALEEILPALVAVAGALEYAHGQGIVHRDLKTSNILIDRSGEPRLLDFGIAGLLERGRERLEIRGGGSEGTASPQQLAGGSPAPVDDVYAFGILARDLTSGQRVPTKLEALLNAMTNRDPRYRPKTMSEVKETLDEILRGLESRVSSAEAAGVKLTPPPRVARTVEPVDFAPVAAERSTSHGGGIGWKTVATFVLLVGLAAGVFFVLPRWVDDTPPAVEPSVMSTPVSPPEPTDLRDLAQEKAQAEDVRERAAGIQDSVQSRNAQRWGGEPYRLAVAAMAAGDEHMRRRAFGEAQASYRAAITHWETVRSTAGQVTSDAVRRGNEALEAGSSTEAAEAFALAIEIQPSNAAAKRGLERARVLDEVRTLVTNGEALEARGDLAQAAQRYREAISLDQLSEAAQRGLARIDARASEEAFTDAMTEAVSLLNAKNFTAAREAFLRARAIKPEARDVADGLKAVDEGERLATIAEHREKALALERQEEWRSAEEEYDAVLGMDPTIRFAQEGKARSKAQAELSEKLEFHIKNPERLSDEKVLEEASLVLQQAAKVEDAGVKLREQLTRLEALVGEFSTPVQVYLLSDNETEVVVYKVGNLGKFERHSLVLRPGTYTVVGSRRGYRDVRLRLVVAADKPPEPLMIRCEEAI